ncbi:MAG: MptD family putative ECF transporter S component [Lachnospiraceae bacterium]|nr:MptD family putative ECF transporter S component [Lachnospiraceae bacterium]
MEESKKLTGRDFITIGIFSAIYFVLNLAAMITGIVPVLWLLLPGVAGIVTGIPFMLMEAKVRKPGAVLIMGAITALLYYVTGQFTVLLLITFAVACVLSEVYRAITKYDSNFVHMTISFILFCYGMLGSPLAIWVYRDSFLAQIQQNGMTAEYVKTLSGLISTPMLIVLCISPIIGGLIGALIAKGLFRKHFKKAGVV